MGKGFGIKSEEQLGYVLLLFPEAKAYAARLDLNPKEMDRNQTHSKYNNLLISIALAFCDLACFIAKIFIKQESDQSPTNTLHSDVRSKQEFIGITNSLEKARLWKTIKQAKRGISEYAEFLLAEGNDSPETREVSIIRLTRFSNGDTASELVESLFLHPKKP